MNLGSNWFLVGASAWLLLLAGCGDSGADGQGGGGAGAAGGGSSVGGEGGGTVSECTQARQDAIGPIDAVSTGEVTILSTDGGTRELFVDASAGGINAQAQNPWVYLDLSTASRVELTDVAADGSSGWDLAVKRPVLRTNGGDGGLAGQGAARLVDKPFDEVTAADLGGPLDVDRWFDDDCTLFVDQTGAIRTVFDGWYGYIDSRVVPLEDTTWIVRGGTGSHFKLAILDYYANADGSSGQAGGRYRLLVAPLD